MSRTVRLARAAGILSRILAALLVVIYMPGMSYHSRTMARLHNFAHMPLFTLVAILLAAIWPGGLFRDGRPRPLPMLRLWLVALLAGAALLWVSLGPDDEASEIASLTSGCRFESTHYDRRSVRGETRAKHRHSRESGNPEWDVEVSLDHTGSPLSRG